MLAALFGGFAQIQADAIPEGVLPKNKRQVAGTGVTSSTTASPTTMSSSADSSTVDETSSVSTPTPTTETSAAQTTSAQETSSASPLTTSESVAETTAVVATTSRLTTTNAAGSTVTSDVVRSSTVTSARSSRTTDSSAIVVVGSSTINRSTLSSDLTVTSALVASETVPTTFTSYFTSNGQVYSTAISTNAVIATTTGFATSTISPSLQGNDGSGSSLSDSSKKIIGGVVGGVGGAILLGGIALVAWRLWGKKKRQRLPQDDFLGSQDDSIVKEARDSGLDRYHQPVGGPVNTASNF